MWFLIGLFLFFVLVVGIILAWYYWWQPERECERESDCQRGYRCLEGECIVNHCQTEADCPPDYLCQGGSCVQTAGCRPCQSDADCSSGICLQNKCQFSQGEVNRENLDVALKLNQLDRYLWLSRVTGSSFGEGNPSSYYFRYHGEEALLEFVSNLADLDSGYLAIDSTGLLQIVDQTNASQLLLQEISTGTYVLSTNCGQVLHYQPENDYRAYFPYQDDTTTCQCPPWEELTSTSLIAQMQIVSPNLSD